MAVHNDLVVGIILESCIVAEHMCRKLTGRTSGSVVKAPENIVASVTVEADDSKVFVVSLLDRSESTAGSCNEECSSGKLFHIIVKRNCSLNLKERLDFCYLLVRQKVADVPCHR